MVVVMCTAFGFALVGCGEDDRSSTEPNRNTELVGDWQLTMMRTEYDGETEILTESQLDSLGII